MWIVRICLLIALLGIHAGGPAFAEDVGAVVSQWVGKYPLEKIVNDKSLWEQPAILAVLSAAMGTRFFAALEKARHGPEAPVAADGKGHFVAWSCNETEDCSGNNMTAYFNAADGAAEVCWRSSDGADSPAKDLWLAKGEARPLPLNGCGIGDKDPFASFKRYGNGATPGQP
ncbi:MAG TPA: hypothetical protein VME69_06735 [Methylocella sp.]|nr:hypothetical protein [Methylocella sp.]